MDDEDINYKDPETVPEEPARELIQLVEENDPMKPWTLAEKVGTDMTKEQVRDVVLKPLMIRGVVVANSNGDITIHDKSRLDSLL